MSGDEITREIADLATGAGLTVAVAESLTGGTIASRLAATPGSGPWFRGGVVAYASDVKYRVLGVQETCPLISSTCARAMARGVADLMGADVAIAVTGVGGPDEQEGQPVGTVWFGLVAGVDETAEQQSFDGDPGQVVEATTGHALEMLRRRLRAAGSPRPVAS